MVGGLIEFDDMKKPDPPSHVYCMERISMKHFLFCICIETIVPLTSVLLCLCLHISYLDCADIVLCLIRCLLKVFNPYDEDMIDTEGFSLAAYSSAILCVKKS